MIDIVLQTINFYIKNKKQPSISDINIEDKSLLENKWNIFVTIYIKGEIKWSAWNIREIKSNIVEELIENTIQSISKDTRFSPLGANEVNLVKIRIDQITNRTILNKWDLLKLDPVKSWVLVIKKDHEKMALILPNINPTLLIWEDFIPVLKEKLKEKDFIEKDYYVYKIETEIFTNL